MEEELPGHFQSIASAIPDLPFHFQSLGIHPLDIHFLSKKYYQVVRKKQTPPGAVRGDLFFSSKPLICFTF